MTLELVRYIINHLVEHPDDLTISANHRGRDTYIEVYCHEEDKGRIIGRGGRVINSIRTLTRASAEGHERIEIQLIDE